MREIDNTDVPQLQAAFDRANITKARPAALSKFKDGHSVYADDSGVLYTHFEGRKQELSAALTAWGKTSDGEVYTDRRRLPAEEKNPGGIRAKSDFKSDDEKRAYIEKFGISQFEKLKTTYVAPEEVVYRDQYYALSREQKSALINQGVTAASFPPRPDPDQIAGGKVNHAALAKDKATRGK